MKPIFASLRSQNKLFHFNSNRVGLQSPIFGLLALNGDVSPLEECLCLDHDDCAVVDDDEEESPNV